MNIKINEMTMSDLESIQPILESEFDDFWNYDILKEELSSDTSKYIIALQDDEIIGFAGIKIICGEVDLMNIVTKKSYRKRGVAKSLLDALISMCREKQVGAIFLEVHEENAPAISLYKKYRLYGIRYKKKLL